MTDRTYQDALRQRASELVGHTLGELGLALDGWARMDLADHRDGLHDHNPEPDCLACRAASDASAPSPDADILELREQGYTYGEAEDLADHYDGQHDEQPEAACPACDSLAD